MGPFTARNGFTDGRPAGSWPATPAKAAAAAFDMDVGQGRGEVGVAGTDGVVQLAVLDTEQLRVAFGGQPEQPAHPRVDRRHDRVQQPVGRQPQDRLVKGGVGRRDLGERSALGGELGSLERVTQRHRAAYVPACRRSSGQYVQAGTHVEQLGDVPQGQLRHDRAATGQGLDQAFGLQLRQRLSDRDPGHLQAGGEFPFQQPRPRRQLTFDDRVPQVLVHLRRQGPVRPAQRPRFLAHGIQATNPS